jgi:uncharacterized membrane protein
MSNNNNGPVLSKNLAFAAVALIVLFGVIGAVLLFIFRPDATATFIQMIVTFAGILTSAIVLLYGLGKVQERIEVVQKQTNGTLSALHEKLAEKDAELARVNEEKVALARQVPTT